jgi:hypothetical protein
MSRDPSRRRAVRWLCIAVAAGTLSSCQDLPPPLSRPTAARTSDPRAAPEAEIQVSVDGAGLTVDGERVEASSPAADAQLDGLAARIQARARALPEGVRNLRCALHLPATVAVGSARPLLHASAGAGCSTLRVVQVGTSTRFELAGAAPPSANADTTPNWLFVALDSREPSPISGWMHQVRLPSADTPGELASQWMPELSVAELTSGLRAHCESFRECTSAVVQVGDARALRDVLEVVDALAARGSAPLLRLVRPELGTDTLELKESTVTRNFGPRAVAGRVDHAAAQAAFTKGHAALEGCRQRAGRPRPAQLEGRLDVVVFVSTEGRALAQAHATDIQSKELVACALDVYKGLAFPAPSSGIAPMEHSVFFAGDGIRARQEPGLSIGSRRF